MNRRADAQQIQDLKKELAQQKGRKAELRILAVLLRKSGTSLSDVADKTGLPDSSIAEFERYFDEGGVARLLASTRKGRPPKPIPASLVNEFRRGPFAWAYPDSAMIQRWEVATDCKFSRLKLRRWARQYAKENGLESRQFTYTKDSLRFYLQHMVKGLKEPQIDQICRVYQRLGLDKQIEPPASRRRQRKTGTSKAEK